MVKDEKFYNKNLNNESLIKGVIAGGLFPQVRPIGFNPGGKGKQFPYLAVLEENKRLYIAKKSVNQKNMMFSSGTLMTYFVLRGNRNGNVQVQDCTVLNDGIVDLFTPLNMDRVSSGSKTIMKQFIDEYLNGNHQRQDSMVKNVCEVLQR